MRALRASEKAEPGRCRAMSLADVRRLDPIPSGYRTERVYELIRREAGGNLQWDLAERPLSWSLVKTYDAGTVDDWLVQYEESAPPGSVNFLASPGNGMVEGLLTWTRLHWNDTIWLIDIRVREASRRRGVGATLVEALKDICREQSARGIHVETQTTNYPAVHFYRRHGFRVSGFNDELYGKERAAPEEVGLFLFWRGVDSVR